MTLNPATTDAFRNIAVVEGNFPEATTTTVAAEIVGDTLTITGGFGITITADPLTDSIVINNTGDAVGAYTEITEANANATYYPVFSRPIDQTPFNTNPVTGEHQLDTLYIDFTTTPMSYNPATSTLTASTFVGNLTGDVSGNAGTVTNGVYTTGSYSDPTWLSISQTFVGLGNVTNESKSTMFTSPTFTGHPTIEGVTSTGATGTGNLVFSASPTFTGTVSGITSTMVGLGNVTNESKATMFTDPTFTGTVDLSSIRTSATNLTIESGLYGGNPGFTRSKIELTSNGFNDYIITNPNYTHRFFVGSTHTFSIPGTVGSDGWALTTDGAGACTWTQITATTVGLGNVTNESKATMFTSPTFTGHPTIEGVTSTGATGTGNLVFSASPTFTGTVSGITSTMVGLGNVTNESKATMFTDPTFTGTVSGVTATMVGLGNVTNESKATMFSSPTFTGTVSGVTATHVGLGNVTNESKATMFTSPTFTGHPTIEGVTSTGATGTGNLVFSASPTFTGTVSGITQSMITGNSGFTNIVTYTSGSGNWTVPAGVTRFKVIVLGGGGGSASSNMATPSIGGGGGGCAIKIFSSVVPGTSCAYSVGAGGTAGAFSNPGTGGAGGASTFTYSGTTLTGNGGSGGLSWTGSAASYIGVAGGTATGGDLNITGGWSQSITAGTTNASGGQGGNAPLGLGEGGRGGTTTTGSTGSGYGSGGGGAGVSGTRDGVVGAGGIIIIEY